MPKPGDDFSAGYVPSRGDIVHLNWDPSAGHEMKGPHYGLALSQDVFNNATGLVILSPITSKQGKLSGFEFPLKAGRVNGVAILSEVRTVDYQYRSVRYENKINADDIEEACRRVKMAL